ncbi:MAG: nucleotide exchange factor GrpE [Candidatus Omnitrophota bacterium]
MKNNKGKVPEKTTDEAPINSDPIAPDMCAGACDADMAALKERAALVDGLQERLLRVSADFENYKKRAQKDRDDLIRYAGESFIGELVHIVDNFERAFQAAETTKDFSVLHKGLEMILKEVEAFLKDNGVKKIETVGKIFDPHRHEAIGHCICPEKQENEVVEELQAGYEMNGRVIRPARVKVAKKEEDKGSPPAE